uniref:Latent-transforming growth factor beta-binding protein 1-like n=1 Tax=Callorhinchus milii TaxID=7868 RepID=A0A4W3GVC8_CALMI
MCWQEVGQNLLCNRPFLGRQTTYTECCCQYGEAWGMDCALCPIRNTDDYNDLCNYLLPAVREDDGYPYGLEYESYGLPYAPDSGPSVDGPNYAERDLAPVQSEGVVGLLYPDRQPYRPRTPLSTHLAFSSYDPRSDRGLAPHQAGPDLAFRRRGSPPGPGYGARGRQAGRGFSLRSAPRPARPWVYSRTRQRPVLPAAHAPRQPLLLSSGEEHRNAFQRYEALQAEECGVLSGCENGRCVRVPEGYTCQCYDGFKLDMTKMACVDIDECDEVDDPLTLCRNAKCVNAQGSYRCICSRGYVLSRLPNYCIPAQPLV